MNIARRHSHTACVPPPRTRCTHEEGGEEDGCQGDQGGQHHLGGDLGAAAAHDGGENLKDDPHQEHEVDIGQRQAQ